MRPIKFRAWDGEKMVGPHEPYEDSGDEMGAVLGGQYVYYKGYPGGKMKIMQYTGLKDKNGVEIYEGDIITVTTNHIADLDPEYPEKTTTVEVRCENAVWWFGDMTMIYTPLKNAKLEVTGNIYENPELLEKTND